MEMNRRRLMVLLGGSIAVTGPLHAQQKAMPVIGYLSSNSVNIPAGEVEMFRDGLRAAGFVEGRDVILDYRFAEGNYDRLPAFAAEFVARPVDVIAASGLPAALAAKAKTSTIPVVFTIGVDPTVHGLVASLRQPGGNLTGVTQSVRALEEKQLELLHELTPSAVLVGFLVNSKNPNFSAISEPIEAVAKRLGLRLLQLPAVSKDEIEPAFAMGHEKAIGALLIHNDTFLREQTEHLVQMTVQYRIPTMFYEREQVIAGGLISYSPRRDEMRRQAGVYVGRVLQGAKPADLPVVQPTRFELLINLKTAKALGLTVPQSLLARADEVIE
jgi:putative ABC transport system substrate-binding protein